MHSVRRIHSIIKEFYDPRALSFKVHEEIIVLCFVFIEIKGVSNFFTCGQHLLVVVAIFKNVIVSNPLVIGIAIQKIYCVRIECDKSKSITSIFKRLNQSWHSGIMRYGLPVQLMPCTSSNRISLKVDCKKRFSMLKIPLKNLIYIH